MAVWIVVLLLYNSNIPTIFLQLVMLEDLCCKHECFGISLALNFRRLLHSRRTLFEMSLF